MNNEEYVRISDPIELTKIKAAHPEWAQHIGFINMQINGSLVPKEWITTIKEKKNKQITYSGDGATLAEYGKHCKNIIDNGEHIDSAQFIRNPYNDVIGSYLIIVTVKTT